MNPRPTPLSEIAKIAKRLHCEKLEVGECFLLIDSIPALIQLVRKQAAALEFYASPEAMSCRLRSKNEDMPKCLLGDTEYFQDPADLPLLQDGGAKAKEALSLPSQLGLEIDEVGDD